MDNILLSQLAAIPADAVNYETWLNIGKALKYEGYACEVWDDWSKNDTRYHTGVCEKKWKSFKGSTKPVTGATIAKLAIENYNWHYSDYSKNLAMDWDDTITIDENGAQSPLIKHLVQSPCEQFTHYLSALFQPDEHVAYCVKSYKDTDGKYKPSSEHVFWKTAKELMAELKKNPDKLNNVIGDWNENAGAWIRINPLDGKGINDLNVTAYRYALVESDTLPEEEQIKLVQSLRLPIAALVKSGGKSIHAIVRIDAESKDQYKERVEVLFSRLLDAGMEIDGQNKNPSRLSRLPGVTRNGREQTLIATNIGCENWTAWDAYYKEKEDPLPDIVSLGEMLKNPPPLPEPLIDGIVRCGHKMLISGASKAGKSFLLMNLCICIAEGRKWLDMFQCKQGCVVYANFEIDAASTYNRFAKIYEAMGQEPKHSNNIKIWNLRSHAMPLDKLVPRLITRIKDQGIIAVVIDPIYKVITGDENNASDMGKFCNQFDRICQDTGATAIYCHHHSKGAQGAKKAMDRASGSGVFARDPDAQLDIIELNVERDGQMSFEGEVLDADAQRSAWRMESSLREFPNIKPVNFWFEYPLHKVDKTGELEKMFAEGDPKNNLKKSPNYNTDKEILEDFDETFNLLFTQGRGNPVKVASMAESMGVTERTVRNRLKKKILSKKYWLKNNEIGRTDYEN